jgi:glutamyl-tRNA reductase
VAQFKEAYENYKQLEGKNSHLMNIMEKLFKDAKQIRMKYLYEIGQHSYAGISRKIIEKCGVTSENETILIFGSGSLALSAIKLLKKKYRLIITARNEQKVKEICREFKIESIPWGNWDQYLEQKNILNTIGAKETTLFTQAFFVRWMEKHEGKNLFIDLGSPSVVNTSLSVQENVYRLEDVFERGAMLEKVKESRVNEAAKAICNLTEQRRSSFTINFPFGWEELQFV